MVELAADASVVVALDPFCFGGPFALGAAAERAADGVVTWHGTRMENHLALADVRIVVHEGATHGFSHRTAARAYDERAERAGMESVRELVTALAEVSVPQSTLR